MTGLALQSNAGIIGPSKYVGRATLERPRPWPKGVDPVDVHDNITPTAKKACKKCGVVKPLDMFSPDGDRGKAQCKECRRLAAVAYRAAYPERSRAAARKYAAANRERGRERATAWQAANPERVRAVKEAWYAANRERHQARAAAWRAANPERKRATAAAYRAANPDKRRDFGSLRRARARNAPVVERIYRAVVWKRDGGRCHICHRKADPNNWHLEHIVSLADGGEHSYRNVAVSHPACNLRKGARGEAQLRLGGDL